MSATVITIGKYGCSGAGAQEKSLIVSLLFTAVFWFRNPSSSAIGAVEPLDGRARTRRAVNGANLPVPSKCPGDWPMPTPKLFLSGAAALIAAGTIVLPMSPAAAVDQVKVSVMHGIAIDSALNPDQKGVGNAINGQLTAVDVYVNGDLAIADFLYGEEVDLGSVDVGTINVKMCVAQPNPPTTIVQCVDVSSVGPNTGTDLNLTAGSGYTLVAAYNPLAPEGRPTVLSFPHDTACIAAGRSRLQLDHAAAWVGVVDVNVTGFSPFMGLDPGGAAQSIGDVPPQTNATIAMTDSAAAPVVTETGVAFNANVLTEKILVGDANEGNGPYALLTRIVPLTGCPVPTTISTTTTRAPVVNPTFTG